MDKCPECGYKPADYTKWVGQTAEADISGCIMETRYPVIVQGIITQYCKTYKPDTNEYVDLLYITCPDDSYKYGGRTTYELRPQDVIKVG